MGSVETAGKTDIVEPQPMTFESAAPEVSSVEETIQAAPATMEQMTVEEPTVHEANEAVVKSAIPPEQHGEEPVETPPAAEMATRPVVARADPVIPKNWGGIVASMTGQVSEMIATIIREQEAESLLNDGPIDAAAEIDAMLDEAVINDANEGFMPARGGIADLESYQPQQARPPIMDLTTASIALRQPNAAATHMTLPIIDVGETAALPAATKMQDGVPYVQLPYQFVREMLHPDKAEASDQRFYQQGSDDGDEQSASGEEDAEAQADADENDGETATQRKPPALEVPVMAAGVVADPVYALYQRMVGWE
jgi:hypothetical protein